MRRSTLLLLILPLMWTDLYGQAENVPVANPVYLFLKRMEVKGVIDRYHDAILPLSRRQVGEFLTRITLHSEQLTSAEAGYLQDFLAEFEYDIRGTTEGFASLIDPPASSQQSGFKQLFSDQEKYLYSYTDSTTTFFVNGLLTADTRWITGDALGSADARFIQFGGRIRGTIFGRLGYFLQATNAQFWGSRDLLRRDRVIGQAYTLNVLNAHNFDFVEGYARYDAKLVAVQVGRERLLWGNGYSEKMIASDNVRAYDFIRADAEYKSLKYTFLHAWLLGKRSDLVFTLPSDPTSSFVEPVVADKYFAAHRIEFSFPGLFDIGGQEMVIYSNRSPDLAYLNPVTLIESAQRSREERDNVFWAFDIQTHFLKNIELHGTFLLDDLNFPDLFTDVWSDRHAIQVGMLYTDPVGIRNTNLYVEYTRVKPYVFAHNRSRDDEYTSLGAPLGPSIGSNADAWFFRADYLPLRNLSISARVTLMRHGENEHNADGTLRRNVGGDILQPHRDTDPERAPFLDGILKKTRQLNLIVSYELVNQIWFDAMVESESVKNAAAGSRQENTTTILRIRTEF